ncbi:multidrug ABC transporter ATP-binding protein, putative [Babesia caballi]|uniref:Multidrug ABC transporter ATP-binding protein, putative n=1 Tax=Babesia caballi TaxID=5871 RepID=A0AAV4LLT6_BABCB|nr:multidrug ABC transporter ATP-binding protein, putative [Babesia caballi]
MSASGCLEDLRLSLVATPLEFPSGEGGSCEILHVLYYSKKLGQYFSSAFRQTAFGDGSAPIIAAYKSLSEFLFSNEPNRTATAKHELVRPNDLLEVPVGVPHELARPALLDDLAVAKYRNLVRLDDGGEPVRDDDRGPVGAQLSEGAEDLVLGHGVQRARGLVEHEDLGFLQEAPRDPDSLLLAPTQLHAPFADDGVVAVRQVENRVVHARQFRGFDDLFLGRVRIAVPDVVLNRLVEQNDVLRHDADGAAESDVLDILTIYQYLASRRIIESEEQLGNRRFPRPGVADNGNGLALLHSERKVFQDLGCRCRASIGVAHVLEFDFPSFHNQVRRARHVVHPGLVLHELQEPLQVDHVRLGFAVHGSDEVERYGQLEKQRVHQNEVAQLRRALGDALELAHRLSVRDRVREHSRGALLRVDHVLPQHNAPLRDQGGEQHVHGHGARGERRDNGPDLVAQQRRHHRKLQDGRGDLEHQYPEHLRDGLYPPREHVRDFPRLGHDEEVDVEAVDLHEHFRRVEHPRALHDGAEHGVSRFREERAQHARRAVRQQVRLRRPERRRHQPPEPDACEEVGVGRCCGRHRVDHCGHAQRYDDGAQLGSHQECHAHRNSPLEHVILGPEQVSQHERLSGLDVSYILGLFDASFARKRSFASSIPGAFWQLRRGWHRPSQLEDSATRPASAAYCRHIVRRGCERVLSSCKAHICPFFPVRVCEIRAVGLPVHECYLAADIGTHRSTRPAYVA